MARQIVIDVTNAYGVPVDDLGGQAPAEGPQSAQITATPRTPLSITGKPGTAMVGAAYAFTSAVAGGLGTRTFALTGTLLLDCRFLRQRARSPERQRQPAPHRVST